MHPTCRQVPPKNGSFSTTTVFSPNSPARIAATYPPGPLPMIATSYFATRTLPFLEPRRKFRLKTPSRSPPDNWNAKSKAGNELRDAGHEQPLLYGSHRSTGKEKL